MRKATVFAVMLVLLFSMLTAAVEDRDPETVMVNPSVTQAEVMELLSPTNLQSGTPFGNPYGVKIDLDGKDVLVSQIPDSTTAPGHSVQLDSVYPFESDVCDDITVPAGDAWQIDSIKTWWNNWSTWTSWSHVPNFHVCFYPDSTGFSQPCDSPVVEVVVEAADYTAYGTNPYSVIIDMTSYGLTVPEGTWWIEVQPSNSFGTNGQTGIQEQVGIGNGQESYNRFPLLGTDPWATATSTFGSAYEMGFILWGVENSGTGWEVLTGMNIAKSGVYIGYQNEYTDLANYIHVFGGNGTGTNEHQVYDIAAGTWSTGSTTLPGAKMRYGSTVTKGNFIYMFAGYGETPIIIWDIAGDSGWISTATIQTSQTNRSAAVLVGDLVYIAGGGNGWTAGNGVTVYDITGDSTFAATSLPANRLGGALGYLGNDTLIYTCGYDGTTKYNTTWLGYINPADLSDITWAAIADMPGDAQYGGGYGSAYNTTTPVLFVAGGNNNSNTQIAGAYAYISGTGWTTLPDKPTAYFNVAGACIPSEGDQAWFYCAGGYSPYTTAFERYLSGILLYIEENPGTEIGNVFTYRMLGSIVQDRARIEFNLPVTSNVTFTIYDISGREVRCDNFSNISAGVHTLNWGLIDNNNEQVSAGSYFFHIEAGGNVATGRFVVAR